VRGSAEAAAVLAADKVSKARELRLGLSGGVLGDDVADKLAHYWASLAMLEPKPGTRHPLIEQLRFELEALETLPPGRDR
jgi:hypothetical protein